MKNIVSISVNDIVVNYIDSITELIKDGVREKDFKKVSTLSEELSRDVIALMSCYESRVREHLADMLFRGSTILMLANSFKQIEAWHSYGEDFLLLVTAEDGKTIAAFTSSQMDW